MSHPGPNDRRAIRSTAGTAGIWEWDLPTGELFLDAWVEEMLGYGAGEIPARADAWFSLIHPEDEAGVRAAIDAHLADGRGELEIEHRMLHRDGSERWVCCRGVGRADATGRLTRMLGTLTDISERRRTEQELRDRETRCRLVLRVTNDAIWDEDIATATVERGEGFTTLFGYAPQEIGTQRSWWQERIHPDDRERVLSTLPPGARQQGTLWEVEYRFRCADGSWALVTDRGMTIHDETGRPKRMIGAMQDITERHRAERALLETARSFRLLAENVRDLISLHEPDGRYIYLSPSCERLLGYRPEELVGHDAYELFHPDDISRIRAESHERGLSAEVPQLITYRIRHRNGHYIWFETLNQPITDLEGRVVRLETVSRDVTERVQAEQENARSLSLLQATLESTADGILVVARDRRTTSFNRQFVKMWRLPDEILAARDDAAAIAWVLDQVEDPDCFLSRVNDLYDDPGAESFDLIACKDGRIFERYSKPQRLGAEIVGRVWSFRDITAQRRAELSVRRTHERYADLVDAIEGIVWEAKPGTLDFTFVSRQAERLLGYPVSAWLEPGFWVAHIHPDDRDETLAFCIRETEVGRDHAFEYRMTALDGRVVWLRDLVTVTAQADGPPHLRGIMVDVTERRRAEEALSEREEELRQAHKMEAVGRLAGGVAHDFNNLLTAILGYADLLRARIPEGDEGRLDVDEIRHAAERAADLTRQLLAFSRKQVLRPVSLDVNQVLLGLESLLRRLLGEEIDVMTRLAARPAWVTVDPGQLEQVIVNLSVNARDAMPRGGQLGIEVLTLEPGDPLPPGHTGLLCPPCVLLTVSDTGVGMDEITMARLFEPFYTTKELGKGTGLGLATVYGIVRQSGGEIWVYSRPGEGATFYILLPTQTCAGAATSDARTSGATLDSGSETILLVEDETSVRRLAASVLRRSGYTVIETPGGDEALRAASDHTGRIDLVLTDIVMPGMMGPEVSDALAGSLPGVRVLFMSGYPDAELDRRGAVHRHRPFLQKPFTPESLRRKVREVLDGAGDGIATPSSAGSSTIASGIVLPTVEA